MDRTPDPDRDWLRETAATLDNDPPGTAASAASRTRPSTTTGRGGAVGKPSSTSTASMKFTCEQVSKFSAQIMCRGLFGSDGNFFCVKDKLSAAAESCGTRHQGGTMEVVEGSLILRNSNRKAMRELIVPPEVTTRMTDSEISSLTGLPPMTLEQWKTLFKDELPEDRSEASSGRSERRDDSSEDSSSEGNDLGLKSLEMLEDLGGVLSPVPEFDDEGNQGPDEVTDRDVNDWANQQVPRPLSTRLQYIVNHVNPALESVIGCVKETQDLVMLLAPDLMAVAAQVQDVQAMVGHASASLETPAETVWAAIRAVQQAPRTDQQAATAREQSLRDSIAVEIGNARSDMEAEISSLKDQLTREMNEKIDELTRSKRASDEKANLVLQILKSVVPTVNNMKAAGMTRDEAENLPGGLNEAQVRRIVRELMNDDPDESELRALLGGNTTPAPGDQGVSNRIGSVEKDVQSLKEQLKASGDFVTIKHANFEDVHAWVSTYLKKRLIFGCFMDFHSLCEHMNPKKGDADAYLTTMEKTIKTGCSTPMEAKTLASFRPGIPACFGTEDDPKHPISKCKSMEEFESPAKPGMGLRRLFERKMENILKAFEREIERLPGTESKELASSLKYHTRIFMLQFFEFASTMYREVTGDGAFNAEQGWHLVATMMRRVLRDLEAARAEAQDLAGDLSEDREYVASVVLFCTLKAHDVMQSYMSHNFKDHPSIASELVQFLVHGFAKQSTGTVDTKVEAVKESLKAQNIRLNAQKKTLDGLNSRVGSLESAKKGGKGSGGGGGGKSSGEDGSA